MDPRDPVVLGGVLVCFLLVAAGPLTGIDVTSAGPSTVGEGNASVASVSLDAPGLAITDGRFGTGVPYVRLPPATVTVESVTGRPRLVYLVAVPELGVEHVETQVVTEPGRYRLAPEDQALVADTPAGVYGASLTVRVQSFSGARTVATASASVEVGP